MRQLHLIAATITITMKGENDLQMKTIRLNVGGKHYEVPLSLFEIYPETMLARLVDMTWQNKTKKNEVLFIDRNGDRFQYVLDYMRDRRVHLPMTVSSSAFQSDLEYYGFDNVKQASITAWTPAEAGHLFAAVSGNIADDLAAFDKRKKEVDLRKHSYKAAHAIFLKSTAMDAHQERRFQIKFDDKYDTVMDIDTGTKNGKNKKYLRDYLLPYGLTLHSISFSGIFMPDSCKVLVSRSTAIEGLKLWTDEGEEVEVGKGSNSLSSVGGEDRFNPFSMVLLIASVGVGIKIFDCIRRAVKS